MCTFNSARCLGHWAVVHHSPHVVHIHTAQCLPLGHYPHKHCCPLLPRLWLLVSVTHFTRSFQRPSQSWRRLWRSLGHWVSRDVPQNWHTHNWCTLQCTWGKGESDCELDVQWSCSHWFLEFCSQCALHVLIMCDTLDLRKMGFVSALAVLLQLCCRLLL